MSSERNKLVRTFWQMTKMLSGNGIDGQEIAYSVIDEMYRHRSLSRLSNDQIRDVLAAITEKSGIKLDKKRQAGRRAVPAGPVQPTGASINSLASKEQLGMIDELAAKMNMSNFVLGRFLEHILRGNFLTRFWAVGIIEAMKSMDKRNWRSKGEDLEYRVYH